MDDDTIDSSDSINNIIARSSKYDYVKIRVWLHHLPHHVAHKHHTDPDPSAPVHTATSLDNTESNHWYVLSRYVLSRVISSCSGMRSNAAVTIALQLKKQLVDANLLNITQTID